MSVLLQKLSFFVGYLPSPRLPHLLSPRLEESKLMADSNPNTRESPTPPKTVPRLLIPLSLSGGNDPTEVTIPYDHFANTLGWEVDFATEDGSVCKGCDEKLVNKEKSGGLFMKVLGAKPEVIDLYKKMIQTEAWKSPKSWTSDYLNIISYDAIILPGGHDKPIKPHYLESASLHRLLAQYWPLTERKLLPPSNHPNNGTETNNGKKNKVVGAICHGVLVLAFAKWLDDEKEGKSLLWDVETTTLPSWMESLAHLFSKPFRLQDPNYYHTYVGKNCVDDVLKSLDEKRVDQLYKRGPINQSPFTHTDPNYAYISGRFPGDAERFSKEIEKEVRKSLGL